MFYFPPSSYWSGELQPLAALLMNLFLASFPLHPESGKARHEHESALFLRSLLIFYSCCKFSTSTVVTVFTFFSLVDDFFLWSSRFQYEGIIIVFVPWNVTEDAFIKSRVFLPITQRYMVALWMENTFSHKKMYEYECYFYIFFYTYLVSQLPQKSISNIICFRYYL